MTADRGKVQGEHRGSHVTPARLPPGVMASVAVVWNHHLGAGTGTPLSRMWLCVAMRGSQNRPWPRGSSWSHAVSPCPATSPHPTLGCSLPPQLGPPRTPEASPTGLGLTHTAPAGFGVLRRVQTPETEPGTGGHEAGGLCLEGRAWGSWAGSFQQPNVEKSHRLSLRASGAGAGGPALLCSPV